jgi:hypothetical protein
MKEAHLTLADFPVHDARRELIVMNEQRDLERTLRKQLEESLYKINLKEQQLQKQKKITEALLHEILPPRVATTLLAGKVSARLACIQICLLLFDA